MTPINLAKADDVDDQHFKEFEGRLKVVLPVMKLRYSARALGIDEANWHRYLTGEYRITQDIIYKFDIAFQFILKDYPAHSVGFYPTRESDTPYKEIDKKLAELAAGQQRLEEKIDTLLQKDR
ncbi:MAG TPA: hypothetical protein VMH27_11770 [Puia sp.]|nr:hypothetical protein [Puia sp.]